MLNINLLPDSYRQKKRAAQTNATTLMVCITILSIAAIAIIILGSLRATMALNLSLIQSHTQELQNQIKGVRGLVEKVVFVNDRVKTIEQVQKNQPLTSDTVAALSALVPQNMQIASLALSFDKTPNISFTVKTASVRDIIKFQEKVEDSGWFKDVAIGAFSISTSSDAPTSVTTSVTSNLEKKGQQ